MYFTLKYFIVHVSPLIDRMRQKPPNTSYPCIFPPNLSSHTKHPFHPVPIHSRLLTSRNRPIHRIVPRPRNLGFKIQINQLPLLTLPLPIRVPVKYYLITPGISHFKGGMAECSFGAPFKAVAGVFGDQEGGGAATVVIVVEAGFNGVIEDVAGGYFFWFSECAGEGETCG